jgi:hypothetical protein
MRSFSFNHTRLVKSVLSALAVGALMISSANAQVMDEFFKRNERRQHQQQQQGVRPAPAPQPQVQPQPQYRPQPQPQVQYQQPQQYHQPRPHYQPRPQIFPVIVPQTQYIDRPVYIDEGPRYAPAPRYYDEQPVYRGRQVRRRASNVCRTIVARDKWGGRHYVKKCRPARRR